jgi:ABC-2 type transport system permease protein
MIAATVVVMARLMARDRPTLVLFFVLPALVFIVLTAVFKESVTRVPDVAVATLEAPSGSAGAVLGDTLAKVRGLKAGSPAASLDELRGRVATGKVEVGVVPDEQDPSPITAPRWRLLAAPGHEGAAQIVSLRLTAALGVPQVPGQPDAGPALGAPVIDQVGTARGDPVVLDEAGAIAAMFLMLAGIQVAATLVDERESGIHDRVAGSGSVAGLVLGKFMFGVLIGTVQAALIMVTATLVFHVDVLAAPARLAVASVLTAAMATSLTLLVASCCSTRQQAQAISTFGILVLSTLGGSMVPLRLMPPWLERIGGWTPNAWSIDAFRDALTGGADWRSPHPSWALIACASLVALSLAVMAYRRPAIL